MNIRSKKYGLVVCAVAMGVSTLFFFQNCSSSLPSNLDDSSNQSSSVPAVAVYAYAQPTNLSTGDSAILSVQGGKLPYTPSASAGVLTRLGDTTFSYVAPTTAGTYTISVIDAQGVSAPQVFMSVSAKSDSSTGTTVTTSASKQVYSFYNSSTGYHAYSDQEAWSASGFAEEGPAYKVLVDAASGGVPIYQCKLTAGGDPEVWLWSSVMYYDSLDANCENQPGATSVQTGYVYASDGHAGAVPLYRYVNDANVDHMSSTNANLVPQLAKGWRNEGIRAWVPAN